MKNYLRTIKVFYSPKFPELIVYMLQSVEYQGMAYLTWFWKTQDFSKVKTRKELDRTKAAMTLLKVMYLGIAVEILIGIVLIILGLSNSLVGGVYFGIAVILVYPVLWSQIICLPLILAREIIVKPKEKKLIIASKDIFSNTKAKKIVVAGSYGKTSMKELLSQVLSAGLNVAATPANKNVAVSHAVFANKLTGKEDVLIIELGEGAPGDVVRFAKTINPDIGVITGLSPAHLDKYKTLKAAGEDIFSLSKFVDKKAIYVNADSASAKDFIKPEYNLYSSEGLSGWKVSNVVNSINGISFQLTKKTKTLKVSSGLIGRHQIGPLVMVIILALELGIKEADVLRAIKSTTAYEHRMQPYKLKDSWIIDDTYNGNIDGIKAGTSLLGELKAKRKTYVTPGLVDQGEETKSVHIKMGEYIANAKPDRVVLMNNSVTKYIKEGLDKNGYLGELIVENDPLNFYTNISEFVAAGDLVLMQNDWTDNYL